MPSALFVHNGRPGRFASIGAALLKQGWTCTLINDAGGNEIPGIRCLRWRSDRQPNSNVFEPARRTEADFLRGHAAMACAAQLKSEGFEPSVIIGHPGWGEMLFLDEVYPNAPQIQIGEYYYRTRGSDVDFDPEFKPTRNATYAARVLGRNA